MRCGMLCFAAVMIVNGIYVLFDIFPKPKGSKLYFGEEGNVYMGFIFIAIGILLIGYEIYKKRKSKDKKKQ